MSVHCCGKKGWSKRSHNQCETKYRHTVLCLQHQHFRPALFISRAAWLKLDGSVCGECLQAEHRNLKLTQFADGVLSLLFFFCLSLKLTIWFCACVLCGKVNKVSCQNTADPAVGRGNVCTHIIGTLLCGCREMHGKMRWNRLLFNSRWVSSESFPARWEEKSNLRDHFCVSNTAGRSWSGETRRRKHEHGGLCTCTHTHTTLFLSNAKTNITKSGDKILAL